MTPAQQAAIPDITAHETAEQDRIRRAEAEYRQKESTLRAEQAAALQEAERDERAAASLELQAFNTNDIPRILQAGEAGRQKAVEQLEINTRSKTQPVLKKVIADAMDRFIKL